jgi:RimJ/RimL family protein N-acetyltransferase
MEAVKTSRLWLRDLKESDWQAVYEYASDPEVVRYMDWGPNTEEETKGFIHRALEAQKEQPRCHYTLAIVLQAEDRLIGSCGVHVSNLENREGWIGYCLNKHFWRKGYATETARAVVDFGFRKLGLHRVFATCDPANTASAHVLEKAGMKREGRIREHKWAKGKWRDSYLYAALEQESRWPQATHRVSQAQLDAGQE